MKRRKMSNNFKIPDILNLFVYGTLKKGCTLNSWLSDAKFIKNARLGGYTLYSLGAYSIAVKEAGSFIEGEIYEVDEKSLKGVYWMEIGAGFTFLEVDKKENLFMFYYKTKDFEKLNNAKKIGSKWE